MRTSDITVSWHYDRHVNRMKLKYVWLNSDTSYVIDMPEAMALHKFLSRNLDEMIDVLVDVKREEVNE